MTGRSVNDTSSGPSTGSIPAEISSSQRLARAILFRAAKDLRTDWIKSTNAASWCEQGDLGHSEYIEAVEYVANAPEAQRPILLQIMKRKFGLR